MTEALAAAMPDEGQALPEPVDDERFQRIVKALHERARSYMLYEPLPAVERGWRYYDGDVDFEPAGDTGLRREDGSSVFEGSSLVMTECRDTVDQLLPEIARVFLGTDKAVEFKAQNEEDADGAEQASDYANHIFKVENDGDNLILDMALDWLIKYAGVKVWWEEDERRQSSPFSGLSREVVALLAQEIEGGQGDMIAMEAEPGAETVYQPVPTPDGGVLWQAGQVESWSGTITRLIRDGRIKIELIPHRELMVDGDAARVEEARFVGQCGWRLAGDVVALGVPYDEVMRHKGKGGPPLAWGTEQRRYGYGRQGALGGRLQSPHSAVGDDALDWVYVVEACVRVDRDMDGVPERYRILALGENCELVSAVEDDSVGYVVSSPYRRPHRIIGDGVPERTDDLQDSSTAIFRLMMDNLARSIRGVRETISSENTRAYNDLNSWFAGPIRLDRGDQLGFHVTPFVAQNAFPFFDFMQQRAASRTGISLAGSGLDPDALKNQTLEGAHAVVSAPQSRIEYLVREFAVSLVRPIFREIHRLAVRYQDRPTTIRLRNKWVTVDPRSWNASMDAEPRVGLGTGSRAERFLALQLISAKQEQLLATGSPLVTVTEYRNTLVAMAELAGEKHTERYFKDVSDEELQQLAAQAAQAAQQQQQQLLQQQVEIERAKAGARAEGQVQAAQATAQVKGQVEAQKVQLGAQAQAAKDTRKAALDGQIAQLKASTDLERSGNEGAIKLRVEQLKSAADREQSLLDNALEERLAMMDFRLKEMELGIEAALEEKKIRAQSRGGNGNLPQVAR